MTPVICKNETARVDCHIPIVALGRDVVISSAGFTTKSPKSDNPSATPITLSCAFIPALWQAKLETVIAGARTEWIDRPHCRILMYIMTAD